MLLYTLVSIGLCALLAALGFSLYIGSQLDEIGASIFGERMIQLSNGSRMYLKREARGLNFDVVAISSNPDICASANSETDLIFRYDANPLTVSQSPESLTILWDGGFSQPKHSLPNVIVKDIRPDSLSPKDRASMNIQLIDIPLEFKKRGKGDCTKK
jgi:hypothetical protein